MTHLAQECYFHPCEVLKKLTLVKGAPSRMEWPCSWIGGKRWIGGKEKIADEPINAYLRGVMIDAFTLKGQSGNISAELVLPEGFDKERDRAVLVILMHGFLGSKTATPMGFLGKLLVENGYAVLRFDFNGYGESDGAQQDNTVPGMLEDAKLVWDYASGLPFIDKIVLLGHSQGGVVASMTAGRLEKAGTPPAGLILMAPASILKEYARKGRFFSVRCNPVNPPEFINVYGFKIGRKYILSAQKLPIEEESSWFTGPVRLFHGTWDLIVPAFCSKRYAQLYKNCKLTLIWATGHIFFFRRRKVAKLLLEGLRAQTFSVKKSFGGQKM